MDVVGDGMSERVVGIAGADAPAMVPREELEETLSALRHEKEIVDVLYRIAQAVARESDLAQIVQVVTDETTAITGAQFGAFFYNVTRSDGDAYMLFTLAGAPREAFERFPMPRATDIFRPTFEGTEIVRLDDVTADPRFGRNGPFHGLPRGHPPVRSYLAVPVFTSGGEVAGGLFFGHAAPGVFTADHERLAAGAAAHAGTAIERARLLDTERTARAQAHARASAALALEYVADGVFMLDEHGVVRYWNRAASGIFDLPAEAVLGRPIGEAVPGWERIALAVPVAESNDVRRPRTLPFDSREGERWLSMYGVSFPQGAVCAFRDITEEHQLERLRSDLTATVSHELRTPLAAVYGVAQTLRRGDLRPERTAELLELLTPTARAAGIAAAVEIEAPPSLPAVLADDDRLGEVLANLLENATKYAATGPDDRIVIRLHELRRTVRFEVVDRGPGIPAHEQERIFEKFHRLDAQMNTGVRGTGLGLYICRELVERMRGTIGIEPSEGGGATFWFELPQAASAAPAPA